MEQRQWISFFRFPKDKRKRVEWVKDIQRDKWQPTEASYVCSTHFEGGWHRDDTLDQRFLHIKREYPYP